MHQLKRFVVTLINEQFFEKILTEKNNPQE